MVNVGDKKILQGVNWNSLKWQGAKVHLTIKYLYIPYKASTNRVQTTLQLIN